jgi:large subunit ribosomal protein L3
MLQGMLGKKVGMTQVFTEDGARVPVTVLEVGPCRVVQRKTVKTDGYDAVQLGFGPIKEHRINRPRSGHLKKAGTGLLRHLKEFRVDTDDQFELNQEICADMFDVGETVDIVGTTKGRGFQGVVRRYGMGGGPASHGSMSHRRVGSIGASATPSRTRKGQRMPGHMGMRRRSALGLEVVQVDMVRNLVLVKGSVPGANGSLLIVRKSVKSKKKNG